MSKKSVRLGSEARRDLIRGINILADAVTSTLGPNGRNVVYEKDGEIRSTKDGVSVAKEIANLENPIEDMGSRMIKQTAINTATSAGDGTTTSTLLAQTIINEGLKYIDKGANAVEIKRGIEAAVKEICDELQKISLPISSEEQIEQIATLSANNDEEIGKLISTALQKVGREGVVYIEESKTGETYLENVEGIQLDQGYKSHYFTTNNETMSCTLNDTLILLYDGKINNAKDILSILETVSSDQRSLLIIAEDVEGEALATLIVNKTRGVLKVCAIKAPSFGDRRKLVLDDIAILTGGEVVSKNKGMKLESFNRDWFGEARVININKNTTTIIDGKGSEEMIEKRANELQSQIEKATTPFERESLQERLSKFAGGVSIVHVGGQSELELKEKKDRVEDSLQATKAAIDEGIVPGGGVALLLAREAITKNKSELSNDTFIGKNIVYKSCAKPFIKILTNAGYEIEEANAYIRELGETVLDNIWMGFDLKTDTITDFKEMGIIDPTRVTRVALQNASSVAATILLTEAVVINEEDENSSSNPLEGLMGGM